jgi:hydroxypyruvate reductase
MIDKFYCRQPLLQALHHGLLAVDAATVTERAVRQWRRDQPLMQSVALVAIGKAACGMYTGAKAALASHLHETLVITAPAYSQSLAASVPITLGAHPVPDQSSLDAGQTLCDFVQQLPSERHLLLFISGGASAMVELLQPELQLSDLQRANHWLLSSGFAIGQMNVVRKGLSRIKGGGLLDFLPPLQATGMLLSDVPGDTLADIGSGLLVNEPHLAEKLALLPLPDWLRAMLAAPVTPQRTPVPVQIIASNTHAMNAIAASLARDDLPLFVHDQISGDALEQAQQIGRFLLHAEAGYHLWGGETTVRLPPAAGKGGRNQHVALGIALELAGTDNQIMVLSAATDGIDGNSPDAGALVDQTTIARGQQLGLDAMAALTTANSNAYFAALGDLVHTGPTGTNVMDVVIACKQTGPE